MGAWGTGIFANDAAADLRGEYRELIEDGAEDDAALARILTEYRLQLDDPEDGPNLWVALAVAQSQLGRLAEEVRARAVQVIENEEGLEQWLETGDKRLIASRRSALRKARDQLLAPQPARKRVRPPKRHVTQLRPGQVLSYRTESGELLLLRVARIDDHRLSVAPILVLLDWFKAKEPAGWRFKSLSDKPSNTRGKSEPDRRGSLPPWHSTTFRPMARKGIDYGEAGFAIVRDGVVRRDDERVNASTLLDWESLARHLDREVTRPRNLGTWSFEESNARLLELQRARQQGTTTES